MATVHHHEKPGDDVLEITEVEKPAELLEFISVIKRLREENIRSHRSNYTVDRIVLTAFDQLPDELKATIIYAAISFSEPACEVDDKTLAPVEEPKKDPVNEVDLEIDKHNQIELIRLKTWLMKLMSLTVIALLFLGIGGGVYFALTGKSDGGFVNDFLTTTVNILKILFTA
jgi:hypothetical protein